MDPDGKCYWEGLGKVMTPVLCVAGGADKNDPSSGCRFLLDAFGSSDKNFLNLSEVDGFSKDSEHIGMIGSKQAAEEVWPLLARWLKRIG